MCYFSKFEKVSPLIVQNIKTTLRHFDQNFQHFPPILKHTVWWYSCKWKQSKGNPCVLVFVVDICPAVLWLLFRFPTLNTMGVLWLLYIPTISSLTEAKNATIETTFFVEVSESLSLMPWLALLLLVLASGYHHEKKSFCHCPNLISVEVHSKNIIRNIHKPTLY